jgi:hypothetical protein
MVVVSSNAFIVRNPLRQIIISRAIASSISETLALNVFDVSAAFREATCDCEFRPYLIVYFSGFAFFGYLLFTDNTNNKLNNVKLYSSVRKTLSGILFALFLILGKAVDNAI